MDRPPDDAEYDDAEYDDAELDAAELDQLLYDAVLAVPDDFGEPGEDREEPPVPAEEEPHTALPPKMESWRKRSATGAVLTGFALGLQEVFQPKRDEPAIVVQTSGDPPKDLPVDADFEYQRPRQSVVSIRPWLLEDQQAPGQVEGDRRDDGTPAPGQGTAAGPDDPASTP